MKEGKEIERDEMREREMKTASPQASLRLRQRRGGGKTERKC